ncbi:MAG: (2Fe-2S)-binding protein, partial [Acidobacteria bacterium]|nr:(2Fe-2S)-binding protein [Acidobacteriota bacterium]
MAEITLNINGQDHTVQVAEDVPLLWVIREHLQMTGTK